MRQKTTHTLGALHPILFFIIVYGISLCMAFMVCTSIYHYIHGEEVVQTQQEQPSDEANAPGTIAMASH